MTKYAYKKLKNCEDDDVRKKIGKFICQVGSIRNNSFRKSLLDDILYKLTNNDVVFDDNNYLFLFDNAVFDLNEGKIIKSNPLDYMSISCGYDYVEVNEDLINELHGLLNTIFPDVNVKNHYLEILATGLCGLQIEKNFIATGKGGNGKSLINSLMLKTTGNYGYKLPSAVLLKEIKQGANPEVANLDGKRFTLIQEPDPNKKICASTLKELTGDKTLNVRALYSNKCVIQLKLTIVMEANDLPKLDEVNDALSRRTDITPFISKAVSKEIYDAAEDKTGLLVANPEYKTDEFQNKLKSVLFFLLLPYFKDFKNNKYVLSSPPEIIKQQNNKYLANSDTLYEWFISKYQQCDGEVISIGDIWKVWEQDILGIATLSRRMKGKYTSKAKLLEAIEMNIFLSKSLKGRNKLYGKKQLSTPSMCGWKRKDDEENENDE